MKLLFVAVGGAAGALLRYGATLLLPPASPSRVPWATLAVNLIGALLIGVVASAVERVVVHANIQLLLTVGVLGAFTTFSTYMLESLLLIQGRSFGLFVGYDIASK